MKIRIAVVTAKAGRKKGFGAVAFQDKDTDWLFAEDCAVDAANGFSKHHALDLRRSIVTADVPLPEPLAEVAGSVEGA